MRTLANSKRPVYLRTAQNHLADGDPLNPRIMVAFGDIVLAEGMTGAFEQAYNHYRQAYESDKLGPSSIAALIGLGHTEANRDNRFPEAVKWVDRAVQRILGEQMPKWDSRREQLSHYLRDIHVNGSSVGGDTTRRCSSCGPTNRSKPRS